MSLSVVIITLNAGSQIKKCLESVKWADEIIVLDSGSTDGTLEICKTFTDCIHQTDWPGFGRQKNRAIDLATKEWVLVLDADEFLTKALQAEILAITSKKSDFDFYQMHRLSTFMGRCMQHGAWGRDWVVRLFKRGQGRFTEALVHESLDTHGAPVGCLQGIMDHDTVTDLESALRKMNDYSTLGALQMQSQGRQTTFFQACIHGVWAFFNCYVINRGFLDGKEGYLVASLTAQGSFYKYIKCLYLNSSRTSASPQ